MRSVDIIWLSPWRATRPDEADKLEQELRREIGEKHLLAGRKAVAIGRNASSDDVLFALGDSRECAVVHLTWTSRPERDPRWPATVIFESVDKWASAGMVRDHDEYAGPACD